MGAVEDVERNIREVPIEIIALLVSPVHRCDGRPRDGLTALPTGAQPERRREVQVEAGRGIVGDRYAGRAAHLGAAVTLVDADDLDAVADELGVPRFDPALARRNVVLRGVDVMSLRGREVEMDCGDGPVRLIGRRAANPCAWMDVLLAPGAHLARRGRGGLRCEPVGSGVLRVGPARLVIGPAPSPRARGARPSPCGPTGAGPPASLLKREARPTVGAGGERCPTSALPGAPVSVPHDQSRMDCTSRDTTITTTTRIDSPTTTRPVTITA